MSKDAYTLKEDNSTGEYHLFKGKFTEENKCTSTQSSICKGMDKSESAANIFSCLDEDEARIECAKIGREVCGTCVSDLYKTI